MERRCDLQLDKEAPFKTNLSLRIDIHLWLSVLPDHRLKLDGATPRLVTMIPGAILPKLDGATLLQLHGGSRHRLVTTTPGGGHNLEHKLLAEDGGGSSSLLLV